MISPLKNRTDFKDLREHGTILKRGSLSIGFNPANDLLAGVRIAFAVSSSVGGAVVRNLLRRRLKAILFEIDSSDKPLPPGDYLIRAFPSVVDKSFKELFICVESAINGFRKECDLNA